MGGFQQNRVSDIQNRPGGQECTMGKQRGPGGKGRRKAKSTSGKPNELVFSDDFSSYAFVKENNGGGHFRVLCDDNTERMGVLRGSMRRRVWVRRGDIVLVTLRDYEDAKADIVHKYTSAEVIRLSSMKQIPESLMKFYVATDGEDVEDTTETLDYFAFGDEEDIDAI